MKKQLSLLILAINASKLLLFFEYFLFKQAFFNLISNFFCSNFTLLFDANFSLYCITKLFMLAVST